MVAIRRSVCFILLVCWSLSLVLSAQQPAANFAAVVDQNERRIAQRAYQDYLTYYAAHPDDAKKLLSTGESKANQTLPVARLAALSMVANQVMNDNQDGAGRSLLLSRLRRLQEQLDVFSSYRDSPRVVVDGDRPETGGSVVGREAQARVVDFNESFDARE
ncbi:MAG: hypothetical protein ACREEM_13260 [Blastocatellia bacterium]